MKATMASAPPPSVGRQLLLVEDEPRLREMLTRAVTEMGFVAASTASAEAAMRMLEHRAANDADPVDIVLLDLNLPGVNGMELFETLRRRWPAVQVIVLTGFGNLDAARRAIHLDVVDFLTKPCSLSDLELALQRARTRRAAALSPHDPVLPEHHPDPEPPAAAPPVSAGNSLDEIERSHILTVLHKHGGNRAMTAAELGISLRTLYYRLGQYQRDGWLRE